MAFVGHKRGVGVLFAMALLYLVIVYVVPALSSSDGLSSSCAPHERHLIGKGPLPHHRSWRVTASIRNNGSCRAWLLGVEFSPFGTYAGSWRGSWGIPAGGKLANGFTVSGQDASNAVKRAISGVTGRRVARVIAVTDAGNHLSIRPQLPPQRLRLHNVWLRNFGFFIHYYPAGTHIRTMKLFDSRGKVLAAVRGEEGEFEGPVTRSGLGSQ
jgi:hypothetical protein